MRCMYSDLSGMLNCAWLGFQGFLFTVLAIVAIVILFLGVLALTGPKK